MFYEGILLICVFIRLIVINFILIISLITIIQKNLCHDLIFEKIYFVPFTDACYPDSEIAYSEVVLSTAIF